MDKSGTPIRKQTAIIRTNCMDCLDRTNVVQSEIGKFKLNQQLQEAGILGDKDTILEANEFYPVFRNGMEMRLVGHGLCFSVGRQC